MIDEMGSLKVLVTVFPRMGIYYVGLFDKRVFEIHFYVKIYFEIVN